MAERERRFFQAIVEKGTFYTSTDLEYLQSVVDEILDDMRDRSDPRADLWSPRTLKNQLSNVVLKRFSEGEHDFEGLKRDALATLPAVLSPSLHDTPSSAQVAKRHQIGAQITHITLPEPFYSEPLAGCRQEIRISQTLDAPPVDTPGNPDHP